jgi:hypothetical protein
MNRDLDEARLSWSDLAESYALGHLDGKREAMGEVQRERDDVGRRLGDVIAWIQRIAEPMRPPLNVADDPSQAAPKPRAPRACGIHGCGHLATIARRLPLSNPSAGRIELWICEPHKNFLDRVFGLSRQEQQLLRGMASGWGHMVEHRLLTKLSQWVGGAEEPEGSGMFALSRQERQLLRDMASGWGQMPEHRLLTKLSQWLGGGGEEPEGSTGSAGSAGSGNDP